MLLRDSSSTILIATISSQVNRFFTCELVVRAVHLREVALAQQVRKLEDVVLDLLVDGRLGWRGLLLHRWWIYIMKLVI